MPSLTLIVPLLHTVNGERQAMAAVVIHLHPDQFIFPLILAWPAASASGETLLVRRDGESIVFLNELRHITNTALKLRWPLDAPHLPAAVAVRTASAGTIRGNDYRGIDVLAAYRPVAGTDWHVVAKIDRDEAMQPIWKLVFWISVVTFVALAAVGLALILLWRQQKRVQQLTARAEQSRILQESEAHFRAVAQTSRDAIVTADAAGNIAGWNPAAEQMFGFSAAEVSGQPLTLIIPQRFHKAAMDGFRLMLNGDPENKNGSSAELFVRRKDGGEVLVDRAVALWETTAGRFYTCTMRDISERKKNEEHIQRLLMENETILRNALVGIVHLQQRQIVSCNRRFEEMFEYAPGELIGKSTEILYDTKKTFVLVGERGYPALAEQKSYSQEVILRKKNGNLFWGAINGCAIDPAYPQEGSIWIYTDISERRQAEQESNKLLQAVEQAPTSIVITDSKGSIEYVNPAFSRISGYQWSEVIGRKPSILKSGETQESVYRELWRTITAGQIWHGVLLNCRKDGEKIWENTSISPIFNNEGVTTHYLAVKEDVTERIQAQQELIDQKIHMEELVEQRTHELSQALAAAKVADQAKDVFLANISHELRTPLSAVIGFASLARPLSTDSRQREYLDKIGSAGKTLSSIVNDLLDLSKIAADRMQLELRTFSLRSLLTRNSAMMSYKISEKGLALIEQVDDDVPDTLVGDTLRLEQILLNLLSNAVKFTQAGRIDVRVGLHASEKNRVCLKLEVADTGIGMREEDIELLFKPFSQTDASMSRRFGGTGLGLAICKRLAEMMDGDISVSSREGVGTLFQVRLWLGLGEAANLPTPVPEDEAEAVPTRYWDAQVLVVDDQPFNRDVVAGLLAVVGIAPRMAANGQEALDLLSTEGSAAFDLVLMDVQMPVMDGITATRELRARSDFADLPIIAMTAYTMAHQKQQSRAAGMNDHIDKPFDNATFYQTLSKWIPRAKQQLVATPPPAEIPVACGLPALRGVDLNTGLALFVGDEARYRYWLSDFVKEAPGYLAQICQSLATGQTEQAGLAAHTLKGRAGMLGMSNLHANAAALETALESGGPAEALLNRLTRGVETMCAEITAGLDLRNSDVPKSECLAENVPAG